MAKNFRLYTKQELSVDSIVALDENQAHYLKNVVKYNINETLCCFDNKNGEFLCKIIELNKKTAYLKVLQKTREFTHSPDIWLLFSPLKKDKTDFIIEKSTELGCRAIIPVITRRTITGNIKTERYIAQSIEAAEQCRRTDLPEIIKPYTFSEILQNWQPDRTLYFMDETLESQNFLTVLKNTKTNKAALFIGPEGGFSPEELTTLRNLNFAKGATLGPRILRAETAALAALSCWQMLAGDWSN